VKRVFLSYMVFILVFLLVFTAFDGSAQEPLVSIDWLQKNLDNPSVIILDIRKVEEY
jgi:thiosulfate/3-mercaptopyruvate sulfurtransferase